MYWKHLTALARFRCVNHKLAIEQGRILCIDRQFRFCKYCLNLGINLIEDEHHVLLICPLFGGGDTGCGKWDYRGEKMWEVGL